MNAQLLTGSRTAHVADIAIGNARCRFPEHSWSMLVMNGTGDAAAALESEARQIGLLISFLNPYIVPARTLSAIRGRAYNVHPCTPAYPGNDPMHFAFYDGNYVAGATLHVMETAVDSGPICAVVEQQVDPEIGLPAFSSLCINLALGLLLDQLPALLDGTVKPNGLQWTAANKRSHGDFLDMCKIEPDISEEELSRRLGAFDHPELPDKPFIELHGRRFVYEPDS